MASILSHPAVPLALAMAVGGRVIPPKLLALGAIASIVPDADVIAFRLDIDYHSALHHRGFAHSVAFACLCGVLAVAGARWLKAHPATIALFVAVSMASHGLLDALTDGGSGIMFGWPFSDERHFAPWQPIAVSPIGIRGFLSQRGLEVLFSELRWIWTPALVVGGLLMLIRTFVIKLSAKQSRKPF